jgi:phage terminase large subunit
MDLEIKRIKKFTTFLNNTNKRINILYGSAGSGKSYRMAQYFIERFYREKNKQFLVLRKTLPALRITAYKLILELIKEYQLPYKLNKTEMVISHADNEMLFKSLDDPEKIKSYEGNYLWIEEATELNHDDFLQLNLRLRRKNENINKMYLTLNPISSLHWIKIKLIDSERDDVALMHSTYKDNKFLSPEYVNELENLQHQDENYYKIYALGQWGILKNIIYSNWQVIDPKEYPTDDACDEIIYGLDFGYNNPSALLEIRIKDAIYYERELLYETRLTNSDLIAEAEKLIPDKSRSLYADSAESDRIEEFKRAGFNVYGADKGKGSVKDGIDFVKRQDIRITSDSVNLIKEKQSYKYREDKDGNVMDEPVKFADHLMDAERYAIKTHDNAVTPQIWIL